jgi:hypothetical protein
MEPIIEKNMFKTMEYEKTMEDLPILKLTPSHYTHSDGTPFWKYWCNDCGVKLASYMSRCKCKKNKKVEEIKIDGIIRIPISSFDEVPTSPISSFDFDIDEVPTSPISSFDFDIDEVPTSPPKLEIAISSYITKDGESKWRYPCGVCNKGLPNAFSFCCCNKCGKKTPAYWSPCTFCTK